MKKGFTLIEIIVCVALLSILGVTSIILVKNNTTNELEKITKKVLEAANVYVETEKDENGNNFLEEIRKGAKGVQIPISKLVDNGYIDDKTESEIYRLNNETSKEKESYYVMFLSDGKNYCKDQEITIKSSWMDKNKTFYLCKNYDGGYDSNTLFGTIVKEYKNNGISGCVPGYNDGLCMIKGKGVTIGGKEVYYYAGEKQNNHLKIVDKNGNELYTFYIVRTTEDGNVKIMKKEFTENAPIYYHDKNEDFTFENHFDVKFEGSHYIEEVSNYSLSKYNQYTFSYNGFNLYKVSNWNSGRTSEVEKDNSNINNWSQESYIEIGMMRFYSKFYSLYKKVQNWYENLNFNTVKHIKEASWCNTYNYTEYRGFATEAVGVSFDCTESNIINSKFGLLTNDEYYAIGKYTYEWYSGQKYPDIIKIYDDEYCVGCGKELTFSFHSTEFPLYSGNTHHGGITKSVIYIRPVIILNGNIEVMSGSGTIDNPYIVIGE